MKNSLKKIMNFKLNFRIVRTFTAKNSRTFFAWEPFFDFVLFQTDEFFRCDFGRDLQTSSL